MIGSRAAARRWLPLRTGPAKYLAERLRQEAWVPLYIGMATDLAQRLNLGHRKHWEAVQRLGATHVHVRFERFRINRKLIERQLIEEFDPPVNILLRKKRWIRSNDL
jgi:excinuclease UvrABC nuclease subunit